MSVNGEEEKHELLKILSLLIQQIVSTLFAIQIIRNIADFVLKQLWLFIYTNREKQIKLNLWEFFLLRTTEISQFSMQCCYSILERCLDILMNLSMQNKCHRIEENDEVLLIYKYLHWCDVSRAKSLKNSNRDEAWLAVHCQRIIAWPYKPLPSFLIQSVFPFAVFPHFDAAVTLNARHRAKHIKKKTDTNPSQIRFNGISFDFIQLLHSSTYLTYTSLSNPLANNNNNNYYY